MTKVFYSLSTSWKSYRPSKTLWFWSCVGSCVAIIILGFTWGGWVTGSSAAESAQIAVRNANAQLAASFCVGRFERASDASSELALLKRTQEWARDEFVRKGGWATPPGASEPVPGASSLCADRLVNATIPSGKTGNSGTSG